MMSDAHVIARCRWETQFDDSSYAFKLQNAISQWSNQILPEILNRCFDSYCPVSLVWRIEKMELDLGVIRLQELDEKLPILVRTAVEDALRQLYHQYKTFPSVQDNKNFRIIDHPSSDLSRIRCFLLQGTFSWWEGKHSDPLFLVDKQSEENPGALAELIGKAGKSETVRRRIIWQWGEPRIRKTVQILEPWHADFINSYADDLAKSQVQKPLPRISNRDFKLNIWYWIFTHLLVERGSLFNTRQFVRSTLYQMAEHYQLDFYELLQRLREVARQLLLKGKIAPNFLQMLDLVEEEKDHLDGKLPEFVVSDLWQLFRQMLSRRESSRIRGLDAISLSELFVRLTEDDPDRMAKILRDLGHLESVRLFLIKLFDHSRLQMLVAIIAPEDSRFILTFIDRIQAVTQHYKLPSELAWQETLDYLLSEKGRYFSQRQYVKTLVQNLGSRQHMEYPLLLSMLVGTRVSRSATTDHFKLMAVLQELQMDTHHSDWFVRLQSSMIESSVDIRRNLQAILHMPTVQGHQLFLALFQNQKWGRMKADELSRFLVRELTSGGELNLCELKSFLVALSPRYGQSSFKILSLLHTLYRQRLLPYIPADDPVQWLNIAVIESLLYGVNESGQASRWLESLVVVLQRETDINKAYWNILLNLNTKSELPDSFTAAEIESLVLLFSGFFGDSLEKKPAFTANMNKLLQQFLLALNNESDISQIFPSVINHPESFRFLQYIGHSKTGRLWLGKFLPDNMQLDSRRRSVWKQLSEILGEVSSIGMPLLFSGLERSFWQTTHREIHLYWLQHHSLAGFLPEFSKWIASLLQLWAKQNDIRLTILEIKIREYCQSTSSPGLDWPEILKFFSTGRSGPDTLPIERDQSQGVDKGNAFGYEDQLTTSLFSPERQQSLVEWLKTGSLSSAGAFYFDPGVGITDWIYAEPETFRQQIAPLLTIPHVRSRLFRYLTLSVFLDAMALNSPPLPVEIKIVEMLRKFLSQLSLPQMSRVESEQLLLSCVLDSWLARDWASLTPESLVPLVFGKILQGGRVSPLSLKKELCRSGLAIGYSLVQEVDDFVEMLEKNTEGEDVSYTTRSEDLQNRIHEHDSYYFEESDETSKSSDILYPQAVFNAGLVLVQSFIPELFERLDLTKDQQFLSNEKRRRAVHCLQFLVTGAYETSERFLVLNKVLCGMDITEPVELSIYLSAKEEEVIISLIEAVISYWPAIGNSSIDGFRGNWLVRDGTLSESRDRWDLVIERRSYDVLVTRASLSYSIIKFPWMEKPVYVTWPV